MILCIAPCKIISCLPIADITCTHLLLLPLSLVAQCDVTISGEYV